MNFLFCHIVILQKKINKRIIILKRYLLYQHLNHKNGVVKYILFKF